jgi:hypothetical protein
MLEASTNGAGAAGDAATADTGNKSGCWPRFSPILSPTPLALGRPTADRAAQWQGWFYTLNASASRSIARLRAARDQ